MSRRLAQRGLIALVVTLGTTALVALGLSVGAFEGFQRRATDSLFPSAATSDDIAVVAIDGRSLAETDQQWPWPRTMHADLARALDEAGAAAIVFDVVFSESADGDADLAEALAAGPPSILTATVEADAPSGARVLRMTAASPIVDELAAAATTVAHGQVTPEEGDGVVRSLPLVIDDPDGQFVPSLSLAAYRLHRGDEGPITLRESGVQVGTEAVPTEEYASLRLNFSDGLDGSPGPAVISAVDLLEGRVRAGRLEGKTVFIGVTEPTLGDHQLAPVDKSGGIPGVLLHANALNTMLTGTYLSPADDGETVAWSAALALLAALVVLSVPLIGSVPATLIVAGGYIVMAVLRFDDGEVLDLVYPLLGMGIAVVASIGARYVTETRHRRRVAALFSQYVPEAVSDRLLEQGHVEDLSAPHRLDATVFFCDLRGFTALTATVTPAVMRDTLHHYYVRLTDAVLDHGGTVFQFVGDEVFAVFGAPLATDAHAEQGLAAARAAQALLPQLNEELEAFGLPAIRYGIGLNSGELVASHIGGGRRRQYTVVGDTVNIGARLCSIAGPGEVVLSQDVLDRVTSELPAMEDVEGVTLKGVSRPLRLYRIPNPEAAVVVDLTDPAQVTSSATP